MINQAEQSFLGCILLDENCFKKVQHLLDEEDFQDLYHKKIFQAMHDCAKDGSVDIVTVATKLEFSGNLEAIGGPEYLAELQNSVPVTTHVYQYAQIIKYRSILRKLGGFSEEVKQISEETETGVPEKLEKCKELLKNVFKKSFAMPKPSMTQLHNDWAIEQDEETIKTGINWVDKCTGGIRRGKLWVLTAPSGVGKTTIALQMMCPMLEAGRKVNFYSVEFDNSDIYSYIGRVTDDFKIYHIDDIHYKWKLNFSRERDWVKIKSDALIDRPEVVIVDYLQALQFGKDADAYRRLSALSLDMMEFTRESGIPVLVLSQVSKKDSSEGSVIAKGAGEIKENCDVMLGLLSDFEKEREQKKGQPGFSNPEKIVERKLVLAKNRYGPEGIIPIKYNYASGKGYYLLNK